MRRIELEKAYDPARFERDVYRRWREARAFPPREGGGPYFSVALPPPNVTGVLHMGHALNISLQDIAVRFRRMAGFRALWVPGADHAGIATQHVVEKRLRARGASRRELGREAFVAEAWTVTEEHHAVIAAQIAALGASVDWSRERFTLDEGLSRAVREAFVTLYERGLVYRGEYLVNWCPSCGTALSDDEVERRDDPGALYYIRYPFADGAGALVVATTRPETLLGDVAVAVNGEDTRYRGFAGRLLRLPLAGREIPVVADAAVDPAYGSGCLKITPAHDGADRDLARRHGLPSVGVIGTDGRVTAEGPFKGMAAAEARAAVLAALKDAGLFEKEEPLTHAVGHCYRCGAVIEPLLSEQWFVRMKPLAEKALDGWRRGEIVFYPKKWERTYERWLSGIRDWCVSRQLWWGHRIPAWRCAACGETAVSREDPAACPRCGGALAQDEDVLDTWFSSWLWPFSALGWPGPGGAAASPPDLASFYPTSALVTAYDIIFFWVARMIMAGYEFTGRAPFRDVYIHGLVRDKRGRKMSKSLGNGVDPMELAGEYGADAVRFTLAFLCAQGQDILIDKESFKLGSRFANKLWNAARYILMNLEGRSFVREPALVPLDRWVYARLAACAGASRAAFESYRYDDAASAAYDFFWNDFCDWYVEATKLSTRDGDEAERDRAVSVLLDVLSRCLRLLHPLLPFVTEELWAMLPAECRDGAGLLINAPYPEGGAEAAGEPADGVREAREAVTLVRALRGECGVAHEKKMAVRARCRTAPAREALEGHAALIARFAGLSAFRVEGAEGPRERGAILLSGAGFDLEVSLGDAADAGALKAKFAKEAERDRAYIAAQEAKLAGAFSASAPPELVAENRAKLEAARDRAAKRARWLADLA